MHLNTAHVLSNLIQYTILVKRKKNPPIPLIRVRWHVVPSPRVDRARRHKVLVEVIHVLEHVALHRTGDGDIVNQAVALSASVVVVLLYQNKMFTSGV